MYETLFIFASMKTQKEIRTELFKLIDKVPIEKRQPIVNLIFDLSEAAYKEGIDRGADIAKNIYT